MTNKSVEKFMNKLIDETEIKPLSKEEKKFENIVSFMRKNLVNEHILQNQVELENKR